MIKINPIELTGKWEKGFALDLHTISSDLIGYSQSGHEIFDTKYTELGGLLYRLKYKGDKSVLPEIVKVAADFVKARWEVDCIIPVPPSNVARASQPVIEVARGISSVLRIPIDEGALIKAKETPELKNVYEKDQRAKLLKGAFKANIALTSGKSVLLFDDFFRSGATCSEITQILQEQGKVKQVYLLALTKTRKHT